MLLYTSSRENESLNDDVVDTMLNQMAGGRETERNIKIVESLTREGTNFDIVKHKKVSVRMRKPRHLRIRKQVHVTKHKKSKSRPKPRLKHKAQKARPKARHARRKR